MVKPEWGKKRICPACNIKYYDLNKSPIICPSCSTEFDPDIYLRSRKGKSLSSKVVVENNQDITEQETNLDDIEMDSNKNLSLIGTGALSTDTGNIECGGTLKTDTIEKNNGTKINSNNLNSSVGWRNNKSGKWEIYQENEIINPTNNFDIIVFKPGYGSIIKSFN